MIEYDFDFLEVMQVISSNIKTYSNFTLLLHMVQLGQIKAIIAK